MKYAVIMPLLFMLLSCNSAGTRTQSNIIVADGTEVQQFENLVFCGDMKAFMLASSKVHDPLVNAWDELLGKENRQECTIVVDLDRSGNITKYSIVSCENPGILPRVIEKASPVQVPDDECLFDLVSGIKRTINGGRESIKE